MSGMHAEPGRSGSIDRRRFLQRVGLIGAFAVPAITTLSMSGVGDAFGATPNKIGSQGNQGGALFGCSGNQTQGDPHVREALNEVCRDLERLQKRHR